MTTKFFNKSPVGPEQCVWHTEEVKLQSLPLRGNKIFFHRQSYKRTQSKAMHILKDEQYGDVPL